MVNYSNNQSRPSAGIVQAATITLAAVAATLSSWNTLPGNCLENGNPTDRNDLGNPRIGLIMPVKAEQTVQTTFGQGVCGKGTLVFFVDNGRDVAFFNLNSQHKGDVKLVIGSEQIRPIPGEEVVVTSDTISEFKDVNPGRVIAFRNPKLSHKGSGLRIFKADFSIASAVLGIKPLQAMLHSKDPYQRHLINEVLKNHAIWSDTAGKDGPYVPAKAK